MEARREPLGPWVGYVNLPRTANIRTFFGANFLWGQFPTSHWQHVTEMSTRFYTGIPNFPPRFFNRFGLHGKTPGMTIGTNATLHFGECKNSASDSGIFHICFAKISLSEVCGGQIGTIEVSFAKDRTTQVSSDFSEKEIRFGKISLAHVSIVQLAMLKSHLHSDALVKVGSLENIIAQFSAGQHCAIEKGPTEDGVVYLGTLEDGPTHVRIRKIATRDLATGQID